MTAVEVLLTYLVLYHATAVEVQMTYLQLYHATAVEMLFTLPLLNHANIWLCKPTMLDWLFAYNFGQSVSLGMG